MFRLSKISLPGQITKQSSLAVKRSNLAVKQSNLAVKPSNLLVKSRNFCTIGKHIDKPHTGHPKLYRAFSSPGYGLPTIDTSKTNNNPNVSNNQQPTLTHDQKVQRPYTISKILGCTVLGVITAPLWIPGVVLISTIPIIVIALVIGGFFYITTRNLPDGIHHGKLEIVGITLMGFEVDKKGRSLAVRKL
jgi:hypothetical protein